MDEFDVVAVGNAKVDIFLDIHDTNQHFRLNEETSELCIKSGDKAFVDKAYFMVGGNAANVSVGVSRLGFRSAIVAEIGSDEFAQKIINTLKNENVSEQFLKQTQGASSLSVIINYKGERTIFEENVEREHDFSFDNISTKWIYLTSLGKKWENAYSKTLDFVREKSIKLAFNPGTIQLDDGREHIKNVLRGTEILFVSKEEAIKISGLDSSTSEDNREIINKLLGLLKNMGPKVIAITDGKNGSYCMDENNNFLSYGITDAQIVEKTGAGDAYASGFLSAVLLGSDYKTAMRWGTENAGSVIGEVGAQAGLLTHERLMNN